MKRIFFGFVWFVVLSLGGLVLGGAIVGGIAGANVGSKNFSEAVSKGHDAGHAAGSEFGRKYGGVIILGALALSIVGTATGVLPGTKKRKQADKSAEHDQT
jgi:hypothetical protein